ncbi:MAG: class I SAM-dependent methyltransferase [Treponema sp.]|nr:class I SAM-dependent methyltransferase [Treponema sp.]
MSQASLSPTFSPEKTEYQAQLLQNRLTKRFQHLKKWARRSDVGCYRLYDKDIPEIPLAIDIFFMQESPSASEAEAYLRVYLYQRPYEKAEEEETQWLEAMIQAAAQVVGVSQDKVVAKTRMRQRGSDQYEKQETQDSITGIVQEQGHKFFVNLSNYLDTGLFMDHRPLRKLVEQEAQGKAVLNLFCYTASFSVYAAAGGASRVDSVDLSNTYLAWGEKNFSLNGLTDAEKYRFTRSDVAQFLKESHDSWDIIVLDPPTFSNSKKTKDTLDINRDWPKLVNAALQHLNPGGTLYFSTNSRQLHFDEALLQPPTKANDGAGLKVKDITTATIPEDFRNQKIHRCWKISLPE